MESSEEFRQRYLAQILDARLELGMTQVDFAGLIGVGLRTLQDWEHHRTFPRRRYHKQLDKIIKLAQQHEQENSRQLAQATGTTLL